MRVAIIADVHGNLAALETVLADMADAGTDRIICLGDVAALGPQPHEVTARLRELGCPVVLGNCDIVPIRPVRLPPLDEEGRRWFEIEAWGAAHLTSEDLTYFRTFQPTITIVDPGIETVGGGRAKVVC